MRTELLDFLSNGIPTKFEASLFAITSVTFGWLSSVLGGMDLPIRWLFAFVAADFVLGNWIAIKNKEWCTKVGFAGIFKKISIFFFVAICQGIDVVSDTDFMRNAAIAAYSLMEAGSIVTKADALGYGSLIPTVIRDGIKARENKPEKKQKGDETNDKTNRH